MSNYDDAAADTELSVGQASRLLERSPLWVRERCKDGTLEHRVTAYGRLISRESCERWLAAKAEVEAKLAERRERKG